jgi:hypothetical protein
MTPREYRIHWSCHFPPKIIRRRPSARPLKTIAIAGKSNLILFIGSRVVRGQWYGLSQAWHIGLKKPLEAGDYCPLTPTFEKPGNISTTVPIRAMRPDELCKVKHGQ